MRRQRVLAVRPLRVHHGAESPMPPVPDRDGTGLSNAADASNGGAMGTEVDAQIAGKLWKIEKLYDSVTG